VCIKDGSWPNFNCRCLPRVQVIADRSLKFLNDDHATVNKDLEIEKKEIEGISIEKAEKLLEYASCFQTCMNFCKKTCSNGKAPHCHCNNLGREASCTCE